MEALEIGLEMRLVLGPDAGHEAHPRAHRRRARPPGWRPSRPAALRIVARRSEPRTSGPSGDDDDVGHHVADDDDPAAARSCGLGRELASATAICGGDRGVVLDQRDIGDEALAVGQLEDALEQERRQRPCGRRPARSASRDRLGDPRLDLAGVERMRSRGSGWRPARRPAPARTAARSPWPHASALVDPVIDLAAALRGPRRPGNRRCRSRAPARPCSPALPASWGYRGSTWRRRRPPRPGCGRAPRDRRKCRRSSRRRDARRRCRRWRTPGCRPPPPPSSSWRRWCRRSRPMASSAATSRREALAALPPVCASRSRSSPVTPTLKRAVHDGDRRRHRAVAARSPPRRCAPSRGSADRACRG